jgi:hypothetical protein
MSKLHAYMEAKTLKGKSAALRVDTGNSRGNGCKVFIEDAKYL